MSEPFPPPPPQPQQDPRQTQYQAPYQQARPGYGYAQGVPAGNGQRRSAWPWVVLVLGIVALGLTAMSIFFVSLAKTVGMDTGGGGLNFGDNSIAVIDISGVITDADTEKISKQLQRYGNNSSIKAIILHIDSPGGGAAASQEIYHEVMRIRAQKHKKVIASVESVGASGAYYIASACDKIYANPASVVGSIGVIMEWTNYGDLMKWAKLKPVVISHGELKDAGDPTREMTPKEQAYFQSLVDNMYGQFVHDVAVGRHTTDAKITPLATGQVWTGEQSQPLGLIDVQGGFRTALMDTARSVGISGEPNVVRPSKEKRGLLGVLNDDADGIFTNPTQMLNRSPGFYFLWK
ncbi:MAG TPA: signal peptide peptidase SppA [Acidobacteriaceae bacterium]|jgi:protease-4|nr:signal peptide peptidase SppA [Acidobacteriaceae bacterium]